MHKRVGEEAPYLQRHSKLRALSKCKSQYSCHLGSRIAVENTGQNRTRDMHPYQHRGYIDGIATHPRNRPIIIGGGDPEHVFN